jgi:hypothetical protein
MPAFTSNSSSSSVVGASFSTARRLASEHEEETFEEFTSRVENEFNAVNDVFELQVRNLFPLEKLNLGGNENKKG